MSRTANANVLAMVALAWFVAACQPAVSAPPASAPVASADVQLEPTGAEQEAMRLRGEIGFQADLAFVRAVAVDPSASMELGIPMLPAEIAELQARAASIDAVMAVVQAEADAAPNDFCGLYIDNQNAGALTSMWRANRLLHEIAIRTKIHPNARIAFRDCRFSETELNQLCDRLNQADREWMAEIPARAMGWSCGSSDNFVSMEISSAAPDAADRVLRHYTALFDLPAGILVVRSDGTGAAMRPRGKVLITVLLPNGKAVGPNQLGFNWESLDLPGLDCGIGDMGFGVSSDGTPTELPCQEGVWEISVMGSPGPDRDWEVYGEGQVTVKGEETAKLTIRLDREPPPIQ